MARRSEHDASPLGELIAKATAQGYRTGGGRTPYHGYYFKILKKQGAAAAGGELEYVVKDKMIGGFALVAYPAEYRNSGVMTFIDNDNGIVYEKIWSAHRGHCQKMTAYNPDSSWHKAESPTASK